MASSPIRPSDFTFAAVNGAIDPRSTDRRRSFRRGPLFLRPHPSAAPPPPLPRPPPPKPAAAALPPLPPLPPKAFGNRLPADTTTTITRLKPDSVAGAPSKVILRLRVGKNAVTVDKIAPNRNYSSPPPPREIRTTASTVDKKRHRNHSSPPQQTTSTANRVQFATPCGKPSPAAFAGSRSEIGDPLFFSFAEEARNKQKEKGKEKEKEKKKRKFSLLLTEEQIEQDFSTAKKLAAARRSSDGSNIYKRYHQGNQQRRKSSCRRKGFSLRVSKEEAEQDLLLLTGGKRLRRPNIRRSRQSLRKHENLIPGLRLGLY